jgi:hypothetical protein
MTGSQTPPSYFHGLIGFEGLGDNNKIGFLRDACQVIQVRADHQGMLTNPVGLTGAILRAIGALQLD